MKKLFTTFVIIFGSMVLLNIHAVKAQTISLTNVTANPGDNILVPINFNNMTNIGAITLFIFYDPAVMTFNGITNVVAEGSGTLANGMTNPPRVGIVWSANTNGVDFPNGKYLDMQFSFIGGASTMIFSPACEIADWDAEILTVTYVNGMVSAPAVTFNLTVFLEGAYIPASNGTMRTDLKNASVLPASQPYGPGLPYYGNPNPVWYYTGTENTANLPANAVDWVIVELRDAATAAQANSSTVIARKACLLMSNGSIRESDGTTIPYFFTSFSQGAFVVIWHRNHLGIMNATPIGGFGNSYVYNFSTGSGQVYGGASGYKQLDSNVWGMVAGNINADNQITLSDKSAGWTGDAAKKAYLGADANLNVQVNNPDKNDYILTNLGKVSSVPN
jgi:hypothetical protein